MTRAMQAGTWEREDVAAAGCATVPEDCAAAAAAAALDADSAAALKLKRATASSVWLFLAAARAAASCAALLEAAVVRVDAL